MPRTLHRCPGAAKGAYNGGGRRHWDQGGGANLVGRARVDDVGWQASLEGDEARHELFLRDQLRAVPPLRCNLITDEKGMSVWSKLRGGSSIMSHITLKPQQEERKPKKQVARLPVTT